MEKIITNTGLQHLAENVFWNLHIKDLKICAQINQSCKQILQKPFYCLRKFEHLSKENRKDWIKGIQSVKKSDHGIAIISYLKWNFKKDIFVDLPFYTSTYVQNEFRKKLWEICWKKKTTDEDLEIVQILAHIADNLNTPIRLAAQNGHTKIVKILATVAKNPNALNSIYGGTPIYWAALRGHIEIVKILARFMDNPNIPNFWGIIERIYRNCQSLGSFDRQS